MEQISFVEKKFGKPTINKRIIKCMSVEKITPDVLGFKFSKKFIIFKLL